MANVPILYSFRRCPYAMRARLAIYYSNLTCELREVVLKRKPQSMLNLSEKGTVPVLLDGGKVIDESIDIMDWALSQSDPEHWLVQPITHDLVIKNDGYFKACLDRYKYFDHYSEYDQQHYFVQACSFIGELENQLLIDHNGDYFLFENGVTVVDMALLPFIRQFAFVDKGRFDALPYPKVQQWLSNFLSSQLFDAVMMKYSEWRDNQSDQSVILFGVA